MFKKEKKIDDAAKILQDYCLEHDKCNKTCRFYQPNIGCKLDDYPFVWRLKKQEE